jgi:hypothetical protein
MTFLKKIHAIRHLGGKLAKTMLNVNDDILLEGYEFKKFRAYTLAVNKLKIKVVTKPTKLG